MIGFSVSQEHSQTLIWTLFDIERGGKMFLTHYRDQTNHLENSERHVLQSHFGSLIFSALLFCAHLLLQAHVCADLAASSWTRTFLESVVVGEIPSALLYFNNTQIRGHLPQHF